MNDMGTMIGDEAQWYVQKGSRVLGPFSASEVGRFLLLGRVRSTDRVSRDGELWEPVTQVPELVPEELLNLDAEGAWPRFLEARSLGDERRRSVDVEHERRGGDDMAERLREEWRRAGAEPGANESRDAALPWSLFALTLAALGVVLWLNAAGG